MEDAYLKYSRWKISGFTLPELIAVLILISIISAIAIARWPGTSLNLVGQSQELLADIRYAQFLAITNGQRYRVNFTISAMANNYTITTTTGTLVVNPATGNTTINLVGTGILLGTLTNLPNNLIAFDEQGIPYTDSAGSTTPLATTATIPLISSGITSTVQITPVTGSATQQ